jgi:hypothetical protein
MYSRIASLIGLPTFVSQAPFLSAHHCFTNGMGSLLVLRIGRIIASVWAHLF